MRWNDFVGFQNEHANMKDKIRHRPDHWLRSFLAQMFAQLSMSAAQRLEDLNLFLLEKS